MVDLAVRCDNQRGEATAIGVARVAMPSRNFDAPQPGVVIGET